MAAASSRHRPSVHRVLPAALVVLTGVLAALAVAAGVDAKPRPAHIELPDGFQPEGIAHGRGNELFVGSIPTGSVLRVDARTGAIETAVPPREGHVAVGLKADRHGRLFVAGGPTGKAFVYDAETGAELASFQLAPEGEATFVNDVALTKRWAYFTDSQRPVIYAVRADLSGFEEIELEGFELVSGFNLNGIVATQNGKQLLAVQSATGDLWRIDPRRETARRVDIGPVDLRNGDGLLLTGRLLYVVRNFDNEIAVLRLGRKLRSARLKRTLTSPDFDVPTTIARHGSRLYAVNARFGTEDPETADYWITRVKR